jgi:hypothetical protein
MGKTASRWLLSKAIDCLFTKIITTALRRVHGAGAGGRHPGRILLRTKSLDELRVSEGR